MIRSGLKAFNQAALGAIAESSFPLPQVAPTLEERKNKKNGNKITVSTVKFILPKMPLDLPENIPQGLILMVLAIISFCCVAYV